MVKVKTPFKTEDEANEVAEAIGVINYVSEKVLNGDLGFTKKQEKKIKDATETLNRYSPQEVLLFIYWSQVGDKA
ncbi:MULTISPECIES: hypothetical protein [Bacillus]|uniref:Uncharacterized protein n=1 Tax=Bacillus swezeyi TaxID=1925020 RepID=A0A5M8RSP0_9BACI|nr:MULTISPECIES: hypothetical protein [Bacillus]KAA6450508.1 hypothetical protein DX927_06445 [Bacillus swezeyi]QHZ46324.1 hypothetical protein M654_008450 [Bacillus sp. NSP9.1]TYS37044.1 hypothetical protein FZC77_06295 [Bacillus swezeyi]